VDSVDQYDNYNSTPLPIELPIPTNRVGTIVGNGVITFVSPWKKIVLIYPVCCILLGTIQQSFLF